MLVVLYQNLPVVDLLVFRLASETVFFSLYVVLRVMASLVDGVASSFTIVPNTILPVEVKVAQVLNTRFPL